MVKSLLGVTLFYELMVVYLVSITGSLTDLSTIDERIFVILDMTMLS